MNYQPNREESVDTPATVSYHGLDISFKLIQQAWHNLFKSNLEDGILGILAFSQGTVFIHELLLSSDNVIDLTRLQFAILIGGFASQQKQLCYRKFMIPSLHWIGRQDTRVPPHRSEELATCFLNPQIHYHDKGHLIPQSLDHVGVYLEFLDCVGTTQNWSCMRREHRGKIMEYGHLEE